MSKATTTPQPVRYERCQPLAESEGEAMTADIGELRRLLSKTSHQPWAEDGDAVVTQSFAHPVADVPYGDDRALIVAAVNALPKMLDEVERLRGLVRDGAVTEELLAAHVAALLDPEGER